MILIDTNIIIDFWKNPTTDYKRTFLENDVFICGIVKSELFMERKTKILSRKF